MSELESWLAAVERGDPQAEAAIPERLRRFVTARLRRAAARRNWFWLTDLDEVAQEVLVRFVVAVREGRFRYRDDHQLLGFLVRTAFYVAMAYKDASLHEEPLSGLESEDEETAPADRFDLLAFAESAFDTYGRRACLQELYRCIGQLADSRREVLRLTLLGYDAEAIARRMGRTRQAVYVLKHRAIEELRPRLEAADFMANCGKYFLAEEGDGR